MNAAVWRRSCHANGQCVEVAEMWRRSSACAPDDCCVEVARFDLPLLRTIGIRDSKHPDREHLDLLHVQWVALINHLKEN